MKQEIKLTQALGKTLESVAFSFDCAQAVLVFTDGTFSTIGRWLDDDPGDERIMEDSLNWDDFGDAQLIRVGVSTQDELNNIRAIQQAQFKQEYEVRDKAEFERLKKKFET